MSIKQYLMRHKNSKLSYYLKHAIIDHTPKILYEYRTDDYLKILENHPEGQDRLDYYNKLTKPFKLLEFNQYANFNKASKGSVYYYASEGEI